jgi:hypothetical protein
MQTPCVRAGALDAHLHRFARHHLAVALAAVDGDHRAVVEHDLGVGVAHAGAAARIFYVARQHANAMAVVTMQVGHHQILGHQAGLVGGTTVGFADRAPQCR